MRVVVAYKWAANPADARARDDGSVDWSRAKAAISEYDPVAIEVGRRLTAAATDELVGLTVGGPAAASPMATKAALARGLDRLVVVTGPELEQDDPLALAAQLAAAIRRLAESDGPVDLVLTGDASVDLGARVTHALVAGFLGWPALAEAESVSATDAQGRSGRAVVTRTGPLGVETLELALPAVVAVAAGAVKPKVPSMKDILAASKKPVDRFEPVAAPAVAGLVEPLERAPLAAPARRRQMIDGDPAEAAATLVEELRREGVLAIGGVK